MSEKQSVFLPEGYFEVKAIPQAEIADIYTSKELIADDELDSFYFRALEEKNIFLNEKQIEAVRTIDKPVLAIAAAGSGKTRVLASRVGYLMCIANLDATRILVLTFTRKAADEMKERIAGLPGISKSVLNTIVAGTFHSVFLRILRSRGYNQRILSNEKFKHIIIKNILKKYKYQDAYDPETVLSLISYYKNTFVTPENLPVKTPIEKEIKTIYHSYEEWKADNNQMDFDDILLYTYQLLLEDYQLLELLQNKFLHILVDEYQDISLLQQMIVKMLAYPQKLIFGVGDDGQTVYSFRGSDPKLILDFPNEYPGAKVIKLEVNYRSNPYIVGLGNAVIKNNKVQFKKELRAFKADGPKPIYSSPADSDEEAINIVQSIKSAIKSETRQFKDIAVLYRTHAVSRAIVEQLVLNDIPYIQYGNKDTFYETTYVRPIIGFLRLALNPTDEEAIKEICNVLYISKEKAISHINRASALDYIDGKVKPLLYYLTSIPELKKYQFQFIIGVIKNLKGLARLNPALAVEEIRHGYIGYEKYLQNNKRGSLTIHQELVKEVLDELTASSKKFKDIASFLNFIDKVILRNKQMEELQKQQNPDAVALHTIHSSKGLEFPTVFFIGVSEGVLPHKSALEVMEDRITNKKEMLMKLQESLEEERRLAYVGITRAESELFISSPKVVRNQSCEISRFIKEVYKR
ncbi:ATP-dependent helicase [Bacillus wiedmannii]|uniref:ATP-dependent helicase n=1 Tax=Bacillus wiedmannii TaxID=1890302 RepID=UPI00211D5A38|nr:ATP-dependent helicase [Bacillus wiedmannii]